MVCNICNGNRFSTYRGKAGEVCDQCGSKARHRIALAVYEHHLFKLPGIKEGRVLHLAPERFLYPVLRERLRAGYLTADMSPERYPHAPCLKLRFPDDFDIFPQGYFQAILHNHVLEHIPGHYGDHLLAFCRLLAPGGKMIFSVPGPYLDRQTIEGGENLGSDAQRLEKFLQEDHFKLLGADFVEFLKEMPGGKLLEDGMDDTIRASLNVRPGKAPFFIWQKEENHE